MRKFKLVDSMKEIFRTTVNMAMGFNILGEISMWANLSITNPKIKMPYFYGKIRIYTWGLS